MFDLKQMDEYYHEKWAKVEAALQEWLEPLKEKTVLYASIAYSLFSGGKRIRPLLMIAAYETFSSSNDIEKVIIPACAIELIHTYSLIHDDLPSIDNSDMRRNKPSNHKIYGDDIALLAGDALLTHAFTLLSSASAKKYLNDNQIVSLIHCLAHHSGIDGMVEGQAFELMQQDVKMDHLHYIDEHKTAALFSAALAMGAIAANVSEAHIQHAKSIGRLFGHAFQIADDLADYSNEKESVNIVNLLGKDQSIKLYHEYMDQANEMLNKLQSDFPDPSLRSMITLMQKKSFF